VNFLDLAAKDPARVEQVVTHSRFAALEDLRNLARITVFHLSQDEDRLLLSGQPARDAVEEAGNLARLGGACGFRPRRLLPLAHQLQRRTVRSLSAARTSQEVDGEIRRDPIEPGIEGVSLVVTVDLLPDPHEDHLGHVARVLAIPDDAARDGDDSRRLSDDESLEGDHVARPRRNRKVTVGKFPGLCPPAVLAVDELHQLLIRSGVVRRWGLLFVHKPFDCKGGKGAEDSRRGDNLPILRLYRLLATLALAGYAPIALLQSLIGRRRLGDIRGRLGKGPYPDLSGGIWVHAVSVGEVSVARNLLAAIARRAPETPIGLSATTAAGREFAQRLLRGRTPVFAFPFDLAGPVEAALCSVRPGLVLLTETEIWPLFLERAAARQIPVALVNGRISTRSFARYRLARPFLEKVLRRIALFAMQSAQDAERIAALGASEDRIRVTGNIKYDLPAAPPFSDSRRLGELAAGRPVLVAASTGEGEEAIVLQAWRPLASRAFLALAPRRPERFEQVASEIERSGLTAVRRSLSVEGRRSTVDSVYLLDSIGELASLYREASLAFVGGTFVPTGGHNPIEAWAEGVPVITGPHMENFREIAECGEEEGFLTRVRDARELAPLLAAWLADPHASKASGERARRFVAGNRGAAEATADLVLPLLDRRASRRLTAP
jgi:3-deoxy-D-manno-octulosonic-acid transferase